MRFQAGIIVLSFISASLSSPITVVNVWAKRDNSLDRESAVISSSNPSLAFKKPLWITERAEEGKPLWVTERAEEGKPLWVTERAEEGSSEDQSL
ncbi:hypothetical protein C8J56DRAFT_1059085 [Mycena floridula]|nr:hypothetical protein C8J56DRAFT_1059085 [Mycena floridula]